MIDKMKTSKVGEKKARTHALILDTAAKAICRGGYSGISVTDLMKEAGLTHGGFYAHFSSRDAMSTEAMTLAADNSRARIAPIMQQHQRHGMSPFRSLVESYLSEQHLVAIEQGCPIAALASEIVRQADEVRTASVIQLENLRQAIAQTLPHLTDSATPNAILSTLVGGLQLARALGDNKAGKALLKDCRDTLLTQYDLVGQNLAP